MRLENVSLIKVQVTLPNVYSLPLLAQGAQKRGAGVMRIIGIIVLGAALLFFGAVAWYKIFQSYTYRYRMTVEVDDNGTVRTGSSVIQVTAQKQRQIISGVLPVIYDARGEAVFVDLGNGRNVLALLASGPTAQEVDYPTGIVRSLFEPEAPDPDLPKYPTHGRRELPLKLLPTFVTFADLNDPNTARLVYPNMFSEALGSGIRLKDVSIEMTNDPVTAQIQMKLPWWGRPGRPAEQAYRAWLQGQTVGPAIGPEVLFRR